MSDGPFLLHHLVFAYPWQVHTSCKSLELEVWIAWQRMGLVLLECVSIGPHVNRGVLCNARISSR